MRNLKRALSLTLASVMLLGMMVVGSSALSFNDADKISNVTAASVLQDLGVMVGNDGNFMPEAPVSRAQMAIIICRIMYGNRLNVDSLAAEARFTDVPAGEYYTGYVNFAAQRGIIGGYGDGRFGPDDTVTTAQAALMLARGLGYYKAGEDQGDWGAVSLNAIALGTKLKMFGDLRLGTNALLSRDNVAEMTFNTMTKANPVEYSEFFKTYYTDMTNPMAGVQFDYLQTLGYKNYDLVYKETTNDLGQKVVTWGTGSYTGASDNKGDLVAANVTIAKKDEIIVVEQGNTVIYTSDMKKKDADIAKDLKGYTVKSSNIPVVVNGKDTPATYANIGAVATAVAGLTGNGYTVKVYTNAAGEVSSISAIQEQLAKVVSVNKVKKEITVQTAAGNVVVDEKHDAYANLDGKVAAGDYILVVYNTTDKIKDAYVGESVTGVMTTYNSDNAVTVNGKQYKKSDCAKVTDTALKAPGNGGYTDTVSTGTFYLDSNGYCIAVTGSTKVTGENICFVAFMQDVGDWGTDYQAYVYLPDGTKGVYNVSSINGKTGGSDIKKVADDNNGTGLFIFTLSEDGKSISLKGGARNGLAADPNLDASEFTITPNNQAVNYVKGTAACDITSSLTVYVNANTRFYIHDTDKGAISASTAKDVLKVSTGASTIASHNFANNGDFVVAYRDVNGQKVATAVYGKAAGSISATSQDLVFVHNNKWGYAGTDKWEVNVIFTGEEPTKIVAKEKYTIGLYSYSKDSNEVYTLERVNNYNGALVKVDEDLLLVGGTELKNLDASGVKFYDCTDTDPVETERGYLDVKGSFQGYAVVDNSTDKNVKAVYITNFMPAVVQAWNADTSTATALGKSATVVGGSGTSADPFQLVLNLKVDNLAAVTIAALPNDSTASKKYDEAYETTSGSDVKLTTDLTSIVPGDSFYIKSTTANGGLPSVYYKVVESYKLTLDGTQCKTVSYTYNGKEISVANASASDTLMVPAGVQVKVTAEAGKTVSVAETATSTNVLRKDGTWGTAGADTLAKAASETAGVLTFTMPKVAVSTIA